MSPIMTVDQVTMHAHAFQNRNLKVHRLELKLKKHLNIQTTNKIIRETLNHQPWRAWTIQIHCCEHHHLSTTSSSSCLDAYVDHVEYILHESFQPSRIVVTQAPYLLKQEGWGEFELGIVFHLKDGTVQSTRFDLHFQRRKYTRTRTLIVEAPDEDVWSYGTSPGKKLSTSKRRVSVEDIKGIDLDELTTCLESLDGDDLRQVYDIFSKFDTRDMSIMEWKDEIWFDIFGLEHNLVWQLWDFCQMLKMRDDESKSGTTAVLLHDNEDQQANPSTTTTPAALAPHLRT
ncbi:hypothetical protein O0I10_001119 [Lichtheimia ornata]|uniref:Protein AF-9 homolog n=1 Tax=Lichtheimia ornata TaxID=688661 RepID=A0AAD8DIC4_9FUNG|nr:uncharacterized protein O0I10_001119 [Lichtheimia ornata]KAJ8662943.1 hypothetical protein O0I10_001119 [Lichtheimia ornata]